MELDLTKRNKELFRLVKRGICSECIYVKEKEDKFSCEKFPDKFMMPKSNEVIECIAFWNSEFADIKNTLNCFICNKPDAVYVQRAKDGKIRLLCGEHFVSDKTYITASRLISDDLLKIVQEGVRYKSIKLRRILDDLSEKELDAYKNILSFDKVLVRSLSAQEKGTLGKLKQKGLIEFFSLRRGKKSFKATKIIRRIDGYGTK